MAHYVKRVFTVSSTLLVFPPLNHGVVAFEMGDNLLLCVTRLQHYNK